MNDLSVLRIFIRTVELGEPVASGSTVLMQQFTSPQAAIEVCDKNKIFPVASPPCPFLKMLPLQAGTGEELLKRKQLAQQ